MHRNFDIELYFSISHLLTSLIAPNVLCEHHISDTVICTCSSINRSGLLENPEVTYLLTFSIIMLNTDRHNPNIRSDRRMTLVPFLI